MMTCTEAHARLAELLYGDLPPDEAAAVEKHLAGCPTCREERTALMRVRSLLGPGPAPPEVNIDLPRLYAEAGRRRGASVRRWRRAALLATAAAVVLLAAFLNLEVRVQGHQVVLRWGTPPETPAPATPAPPPLRLEPEVAQVPAAELQLVRELVHALAADIETRDKQQRLALLWLRNRLDGLQYQAQERWHATEQLVSALHMVQLESRAKGEKP
jgi:hypothetical protein